MRLCLQLQEDYPVSHVHQYLRGIEWEEYPSKEVSGRVLSPDLLVLIEPEGPPQLLSLLAEVVPPLHHAPLSDFPLSRFIGWLRVYVMAANLPLSEKCTLG